MRFKNKLKTNILLGSSLLLLGTTSCVTESFSDVEEPSRMLPKGKYVIGFHFNIQDPTTRADEYVDGDHFEHEIGSEGNYVIFFDINEKVIDAVLLVGDHEEPDDYIEGSYVARYDVEADEYVRPEYCMAILNASPLGGIDSYIGMTKKQLMESMIWESSNPFSIGYDGNGRFTMTNTVYLAGADEPQVLFRIPDEVIQDAREPFDPEKVIHATVERMVSKFDFKIDIPYIRQSTLPYGIKYADDCTGGVYKAAEKDRDLIYFTGFNSDGAPQYELRKWEVALTGWSMNALAKEEYVFKNITAKDLPSLNEDWSPMGALRTNWAVDKFYNNPPEQYPWQYRRAVTAPKMATYEGLGDQNHLLNFSYNDIVGFTQRSKEGFDRIVYTPENTYDFQTYEEKRNMSNYLGSLAPSDLNVEIKVLDDRTDVLAGTHLIVTARLLTDLDNDNQFTIEKNLYRDRSSMFYDGEETCYNKLITTFNYDLQSQFGMRYHYYEWTDEDQSLPTTQQSAPGEQMIIMPEGMFSLYYNYGTDENPKLFELNYKNLQAETVTIDGQQVPNPLKADIERGVYHYFNKAEVEDGDGKVIINPDNLLIRDTKNPYESVVFHVYTYQEYKKWLENPTHIMQPVRDATNNDIASVIYEWTGAVDHFNEGRMYYFKPVGMFDTGEKDKHGQPIYFCGTVRNNWYKYVLTNINGIGTSIDDPNQPIVPQEVPVNSQIELNVEVIDWHEVDTDVNVTLPSNSQLPQLP